MIASMHFVLNVYFTWYPGKTIIKVLVTKFVKNHAQNGCIATKSTQQFIQNVLAQHV